MVTDFIHSIMLFFSPERGHYVVLSKILGFLPRNLSLYRTALTHRSLGRRGSLNNERLEFLGDAIIGSIVAEILFQRYPKKDEGFLTNTRSKIVRREHLNEVGKRIGIEDLLKVERTKMSHNSYLLGNAVEALVGAVYLDRGYRVARKFIEKNIIDRSLEEFAKEERNYKSVVLEWAQKRHLEIEYRLVEEHNDRDGNPMFTSAVFIDGERIAQGTGYTKKESHQRASKKAFNYLKHHRRKSKTDTATQDNTQSTPTVARESPSVASSVSSSPSDSSISSASAE